MPLGDDILFASVRDLSEKLRKRELSPVELTDAYLERADSTGAAINAYATVTRDLARAQAKKAEQEISAGFWRGPLHGMPYAAKDLLAVRWYPTTWGAAPLRAQKLAYDATVIQKLTDAGAVLLGKSAMVELAGGLGYRFPSASATGAAKNPWNPSRWTCGSSSGSAAIVSAGLAPFAIGSETWGSILCPSSHCGVSGLRPTYGRVSRHGAMALSYTLDKIGPLARTAEDCALVLQVLAGHDPADEGSLPQGEAQFVWPPHEKPSPSRLRIGWVTQQGKGGPPAVEAACRAALELLRKQGASVEPVAIPDGAWVPATTVILYAEAGSALRPLIRSGQVGELVDPAAKLGGYLYETIPAADFETAQRVRLVAQKKMDVLFQRFDVLAGPSVGEPAWALDQNLDTVADLPDPLGALGNLCGLPAISVPCGFTADKLPIGIQFVGRALDDAACVTTAMHLQAATDWHKRRPPAL
ncbi:MAG: Amidase [Myxococcales bacterium]|nr:Amidase [Myxococcales bacterium]